MKTNKFQKSKNRCGEVLNVYRTDEGYEVVVSVLLHPYYWSKERKKTFFLSDETMFESVIMKRDMIVFTVEENGYFKFQMFDVKRFEYNDNRGDYTLEGTKKTISEYCTFNQKLWNKKLQRKKYNRFT